MSAPFFILSIFLLGYHSNPVTDLLDAKRIIFLKNKTNIPFPIVESSLAYDYNPPQSGWNLPFLTHFLTLTPLGPQTPSE